MPQRFEDGEEVGYTVGLVLNSTQVTGFIKTRISPIYEEFLDYEQISEYGSCLITDIKMSHINTVLLLDHEDATSDYNGETQKEDIDHLTGYDTIITPYENYTFEYTDASNTIQTSLPAQYFQLNESILNYPYRTWDNNFAFTEGSWLFFFIRKFHNVWANPIKKYEVEMLATVNTIPEDIHEPQVIVFEDAESRNRISALNVGDYIQGPFVPLDTYILSIDLVNYQITTNNHFERTGIWVIKAQVSLNIVPSEDYDNFFKYRKLLEARHLLDHADPFKHTFYPEFPGWPDHVSSTYLQTYSDSKYWRQDFLWNLQTQAQFRSLFEEQVKENHVIENDFEHYFIPSFVNKSNDLFVEVNLNHIFDLDKNEPKLMNVRILDYLEDSMKTVGRAGDCINVGTHLIAETDSSGNITPFSSHKFTDCSIDLNFITINWNPNDIIYYAQVGTGNLLSSGALNEPKEEDQIVPSLKTYWSQVGRQLKLITINDELIPGEVEGEEKRLGAIYDSATGEVNGAERFFWSGFDPAIKYQVVKLSKQQLDKPLFEQVIGEYEQQRYFTRLGQSYTALNFTIIKQQYENLVSEGTATLVSNNYYSFELLKRFPSSDILLTYKGIWNPSTKIEINRIIFDFPEDPKLYDWYISITSLNTYVTEENNVKILWQLKPYDFIIYDGRSWQIKSFAFGGMVGDVSQFIQKLSSTEEDEISLSFGSWIEPSNLSELPERLLIKLFNDYSQIKPGSLTTSTGLTPKNWYYLGKLLQQQQVAPQFSVFQKGYEFNDIKAVEIDPFYLNANKTHIIRMQDVKTGEIFMFDGNGIPTSIFNFKKEADSIDPNSCFWFYIPVVTKNSFLSKVITNKSLVGLMYIPYSEEWIVILLENNIVVSNLSTASFSNMKEKDVFLGNGYQSRDNNDLYLFYEKNISTIITLPHKKIRPESLILQVHIDPRFTSKGYLYEDYIKGDRIEKDFYVSESPFFYDNDLDVFYTYNKLIYKTENGKEVTDRELSEKWIIKFEENTYFKNTPWLVGQYSHQNILKNSINVTMPIISQITGIPFDADILTTLDRILEIDEISLRSNYSNSLESVLFSSYANVYGYLRGVRVDNEDEIIDFNQHQPYFLITAKNERGAARVSEKINFITELKKLVPYRKNTDNNIVLFSEGTVDFTLSKWPDEKDLIPRPYVSLFDIREEVSNTNSALFQYYKNTLILEGTIDTANPSVIDFSYNSRLQNALDKILVRDKVVNVLSIDYSKYDSIHKYAFNWNSPEIMSRFQVVKIDYNWDWLIGASDDGKVVLYPTGSLLGMNELVGDDGNSLGIISTENTQFNIASKTWKIDLGSRSGTKLTGLVFDKSEHVWHLSFSGATNYPFTKVDSDAEEKDDAITEFGKNPGFDIDTYQYVEYIDVDSGYSENSTQDDTSEYKYVYARDMAWIGGELLQTNEISLLNQWPTFTQSFDSETSYNQLTISGTNVFSLSKDAVLTPPTENDVYKELTFGIRADSGTTGLFSFGIDPASIQLFEIYYYDRDIMQWRARSDYLTRLETLTGVSYDSAMPDETCFLTFFNDGTLTGFKTYIVNSNFESNETEEQPIRSLPPQAPEIPQIEIEGLKISDSWENRIYPPPRVPYSSGFLFASPFHPLNKWFLSQVGWSDSGIEEIGGTRALADYTYDRWRFGDKTESEASEYPPLDLDQFIAQEDVTGPDGLLIFRKGVIYNIYKPGYDEYPNSDAADTSVKQGKRAGGGQSRSDDIKNANWNVMMIELSWWSMTNPRAPRSELDPDTGLPLYVPPIETNPNRDVVMVYAGDPTQPDFYLDKSNVNPSIKTYPIPLSIQRIWPYENMVLPQDAQPIYTELKSVEEIIESEDADGNIIYIPTGDWVRRSVPSPQRYVTEYLIFTETYKTYVNNYNSYIQSEAFASYIKLLQKEWKYYGTQTENIAVLHIGSSLNYSMGQIGSSAVFTNIFDTLTALLKTNKQDIRLFNDYYSPSTTNTALIYNERNIGFDFVHGYTKGTTNYRIDVKNKYSWGLGFFDQQDWQIVPYWLSKLPPPRSTNDYNVAAVKLKSSVKLFVEILGNGSFKFINPVITNAPGFKTSYSNQPNIHDIYLRTRKEGLYNPYARSNDIANVPYTPNQRTGLASNRFCAYNDSGYQCYIIGDQLFVYGPTRSFTRNIIKENGVDTVKFFETTSTANHWKRASLPNKRHIEWAAFKEMSLADAISYAVNAREVAIQSLNELVSKNSGNPDSVAALQTTLTWVKAHPIWGGGSNQYYNNTPDVVTELLFQNEEDIPTTYVLTGVQFILTENGVQPNFSGDTEYRSHEAVDSGYLAKDNYYHYLNDYVSYILGFDRVSAYSAQGIREMFMSEQYLYILTNYLDLLSIPVQKLHCRDDIENYNNWNVTNIDPQYVFLTRNENLLGHRVIHSNGKAHNVQSWPIEMPLKGFEINSKWVYENIVIFAGYVLRPQQVVDMVAVQKEYSILNELFPNDSWRHFPELKYPVIFYSENGGKSFEKVKLPALEFIPNLKSYNGEVIDAAGNIIPETYNPNIDAYSIHRHGDEIHIWFRNLGSYLMETEENTGIFSGIDFSKQDSKYEFFNYIGDRNYYPLGYTFFKISTAGVGSTLEYVEEIKRVVKKSKKQLEMLQQINDPSSGLTMDDYANIKAPSDSDQVEYSDDDINEILLSEAIDSKICERTTLIPIITKDSNDVPMLFLAFQPFIYSVDNTEVTRISDGNIEITKPDATASVYKSEKIRVLVSIISTYSVNDQSVYLEANPQYINTKGNFIVTEITSVDDVKEANRCYSYREALQLAPPNMDYPEQFPRNMTPKYGIPAISEDLERKIYQYYTPYTNDDGVLVYDPIPTTNKDGDYVYYCNAEGNYLSERDSYRNQNFYRLYQLIEKGIPVTTLFKAASIQENYDTTLSDDYLTYILNGSKDIQQYDRKYLEYIIGNTDEASQAQATTDGYWTQLKGMQNLFKFDQDPSDPYLLLNSLKLNLVIKAMAETYTIMTEPSITSGDNTYTDYKYFYLWPTAKNGDKYYLLDPYEEWKNSGVGAAEIAARQNTSLAEYRLGINATDPDYDYWKLVTYLEEREGAFESFNNQSVRTERLIPKKLFGHWFIYDNESGYFPIKAELKFNMSWYMPYLFYGGSKRYQLQPFVFKKTNQIQPYVEDYPLTGVYLKPLGYGGNNVNESWDDLQPYEVDYEIFDEHLVQNEREDLAYVVDNDGNQIISNRGLFFIEEKDVVNIDYEDLIENKNEITCWNEKSYQRNLLTGTIEDSYTTPYKSEYLYDLNYPFKFYVYKQEISPIETWVPTPWNQTTMSGGFFLQVLENNQEPEYVIAKSNMKTGLFFVSVLSIFRNGIMVQSNDWNQNYSYNFKDVNGEILNYFSIQPSGEGYRIFCDMDKYNDLLWEEWENRHLNKLDNGRHLKTVIEDDGDILYNEGSEFDFDTGINTETWSLFDNDEIILTIIDQNMTTSSTTFHIQVKPFTRDSKRDGWVLKQDPAGTIWDACKIDYMSHLIINEGRFFTTDQTIIMFYPGSVEPSWKLQTNNSFLTSLINFEDRKIQGNFLSVDSIVIIGTDRSYTIVPDIQEIKNIQVLPNRFWAKDFDDYTAHLDSFYQVFANDQNLTLFGTNFSMDSENYITWTYNHFTFKSEEPIKFLQDDPTYIGTEELLTFSKFILLQNESITISYPSTSIWNERNKLDRILVNGLRGPMLLKKPLYSTYKDAIAEKKRVINPQVKKMIYKYDGILEKNSIDTISDRYLFFSLKYPLFTDGKKHNLKVRVLTRNNYSPPIVYLNNPDYIYEITTDEDLINFGFNRLYRNPNGYPQSPIKINSITYNTENENYYLLTKLYKNNNGYKVYECNADGKYVKFIISNGKPTMKVLGDENGNCSKDIYANIDPRFTPYEPIYKTCKEWFSSLSYVEGKETNPFWTYLKLQQTFNTLTQTWEWKTSVLKTEKIGNTINLITNTEPITYIYTEANYLSENKISLKLCAPNIKYYTNFYIVEYGIQYKNSFFPGNFNSDVWMNTTNLPAVFKVSYDINTLENYATKNKETAIAHISELGLFTKNGDLRAYLSFPPIEYRTDSQHMSFSLLINNGVFNVNQFD